jgi:tetratricopeptide (TPR) repeat protein
VVHGGVFINYRTGDSDGYRLSLYMELSRRFGSKLVFLDSESISAGSDYVDQLLGRVRQSTVVLAVIGTRWLTAAGPDGRRRIDDQADWIRRELAEAFKAGVRVIPVLTDGARMPTEADLPVELAELGRCQFRRLGCDGNAVADLSRLVDELADLDPGLGAAARATSAVPAVEWPVAGWPVPNQLPTAARHFIGRDEEVGRLLCLPDDAQTLVVTAVDGMAGIGKTALVVLAAHRLTEENRYPDGTLFVDLHGYSGRTPTDPADALKTLLGGLGVPGPQIPSDLDARIGLYRSVTARRRLLIVLDNARGEAQVRPLLPGGGGSLVLVTSRRRLAGLDEADHLNLDTLAPHEAGQLFRTVTGPARDPGEHSTVDEIVRLCGYLPLAVRIAAARLRTDRSGSLTGADLLAQLRVQHADRLAALTAGDRSVAATVAISYRHLPAEQQRAFVTLGLHPGLDYERCAAAALIGTSAADADQLLHGLEQVSLLDQPTPGRYRFHDLIRAYATVAEAHPEVARQAAMDRLYEHYAYTTTQAATLAYPYDAECLPAPPHSAAPAPYLPDRKAALTWLDTELPNLLATAAHAAARRPRHTTHQATTLHRHLRVRGHNTDAGTLHEHALTAAEATGDPAAQVGALNNLGRIHYMQDRYGPAAGCHTRALQLARATGNHGGEIDALNGLGRVDYLQGQYDRAVARLTSALQIAQATGNRDGEFDALNGLGRVHYMQDRYGPAADCHTRALQIARTTGNRGSERTALNGLGRVHYARGEYGLAAECYTEALAMVQAIGNLNGELTSLNDLGRLHDAQGRYGPAAGYYTRALEMAQATGNRTGELNALTGLGRLYHAQHRPLPAADYFGQVLDLAREIGSGNSQVEGYLGLAHTQRATGDHDQALATYQLALRLAHILGQPAEQARAHDGLARVHHALGHPDQSRRHWQHALNILTDLETPAADELTTTDLRAHLTGDA